MKGGHSKIPAFLYNDRELGENTFCPRHHDMDSIIVLIMWSFVEMELA